LWYARGMDRSDTVVTINGEEQRPGGRRGAGGAARAGSTADLWLGQQIRALRKAQKLSLSQLAERSDLSIGNLSQIERGVRSPSLRSLQRLSECLNVPIADLFQTRSLPPASELGTILRRKARPILNLSKTGCHKELLTPMVPGTLQMLLVTLEPGGSSGPDHYTHKGEEAGVVISGAMKLWIEDQAYILKEGDSFRFKSTRRHRFESASKQVTRVLWAMTPPLY
jgi:transcriptional regulator with XRE-family HTH domain/mannose-6-phosphate isomerase-like protein (cupin superfamily)